MKRLLSLLLLLTALNTASAQVAQLTIGSYGLTNRSVIVGFDATYYPFVNFLKQASGTVTPGTVTSDQYPANGVLVANQNRPLQFPSNYFGKYVAASAGTVEYQLGSGITQLYSASAGTTISGGCTFPCSKTGATFSGTNPAVHFDLSTLITGAVTSAGLVQISVSNSVAVGSSITVTGIICTGSSDGACGTASCASPPCAFTVSSRTASVIVLASTTFSGTYSSGGQMFPYVPGQAAGAFLSYNAVAGFNFSGASGGVICEEPDYNVDPTCQTRAGQTLIPGGFNPDFVNFLADGKWGHLRFLNANNGVFNIMADYAHKFPTTLLSYNSTVWNPALYFGNLAGTNSYSATCSAPCNYALTSGAPADGDVVQATVVNANTTNVSTLTLTDINSVTSSALPIFGIGASQLNVTIGGTITAGDQISFTYTTTPLGAYTCLAGGAHTTSAYTVLVTDTITTIQTALVNILLADATIKAQPLDAQTNNPNGTSGTFQVGYANNACGLAITPNIGGSATETIGVGTNTIGALTAATGTSFVYNSLLGGWLFEGSGISAAWPWSIQVALAKAVSVAEGQPVACWLQPSLIWSLTSMTSLASDLKAAPCPGGIDLEDSNEVWMNSNHETSQARFLANSIGLGNNTRQYYSIGALRNFAIAQGILGSLVHDVYAFQLGAASAAEINGTTLCGTSCGNQAYQNAIGVDHNVVPPGCSPNCAPAAYITYVSQAPYFAGSMVAGGGPSIGNANYQGAASYGTASTTSGFIANNLFTVGATVTGTFYPNQGIAGCDGTFINGNFSTAQTSGTITLTAQSNWNNNTTVTTSTTPTGVTAGMWMFDQTNGLVSGIVGSISVNTITLTKGAGGPGLTVFSGKAGDTLIFGGKAGIYKTNTTTCALPSGSQTASDLLGLQYAADNFNGVNTPLGSVQDALNYVDQDIRSSVQNTVMQTYVTTASMVGAYNNTVAAVAGYTIPTLDYEGGGQFVAPSTTQATALGLATTYGGTGGFFDLLLTSYKNNALFKKLVADMHTNEQAVLGSTSNSSWFAQSQSSWSLFPGDIYTPVPYQSYNAICDSNGGQC